MNNKAFREFINRKICFLYAYISEENSIQSMCFVFLLKNLLSDISEKYLSFSDYIPLKLIAEEINRERKMLSEKNNIFCSCKIRNRRLKRILLKLTQASDRTDADKTYINLLLKSEKFTVSEISRVKRQIFDSDFVSMLDSMEETAKGRIKRLKYLKTLT